MTDGQGRKLETGRNNVGKSEERTLEKKNRKNDQDDGKCGIYDTWKWKMINEKL